MAWAGREPPCLVWLTTSYWQQASARVRHSVRCAGCQITPVLGMRYQCLQCLSYDLCQNCFFTGVAGRGHKPGHPVQEYCYPSTKREEAKAFFATIVNKFRKPRRKRPAVTVRSLATDRDSAAPAPTSRPSSLQPTGSKLSQLLVRVSPRSSAASQKPVERRCSVQHSKASPVSSGFCSGEEDGQDCSPAPSSPTDVLSSPIYEPLLELKEQEELQELESPGLEWDDQGIELGDSCILGGQDTTAGDREILQQIENFENSIFRRDVETGELLCYQHNTRRGRRQDQLTSILGHLQSDHQKLADRLETASPELVQPVREAQHQLNRLKDLMQSVFRSQYHLQQSDVEPSQEPEQDHNQNHHQVQTRAPDPAESTRLCRAGDPHTPRTGGFAGMEVFSPILSGEGRVTSDPVQPQLTFHCLSREEEEEQEEEEKEEEEEEFEAEDPSLTRYQLGDLSTRLGGTGLYISRDNGLDITEQLEEEGKDGQDSRYADTVEELERLMLRLSDVFQDFRQKPGCTTPSPTSDPVFGLVDNINQDLYGVLAKSKESCI